VAGSLRYFADRFGVPRASIEGTTLSYDLIREHARWGPPVVQVGGEGKRQGLVVARRLSYFGFDLETDVETLGGTVPLDLRPAARNALADALLAGSTRHASQGALTRSVGQLRELWRRSGGTLEAASDDRLRELLLAQLEGVDSWTRFLATPLGIDASRLVPPARRAELDALPSMMRVRGDAAPLEYEVERGQGIVRLLLREGQAARLAAEDLLAVDRPLRFGLLRSGETPLKASTLDELRALVATERERDRYRRTRLPGRRRGPDRGRGRR
jgi:hypothetical protein